MARDAIRAGRVKALLTLTTETAGVYAVYRIGDTPQLARTAVERLIENARTHFDAL